MENNDEYTRKLTPEKLRIQLNDPNLSDEAALEIIHTIYKYADILINSKLFDLSTEELKKLSRDPNVQFEP